MPTYSDPDADTLIVIVTLGDASSFVTYFNQIFVISPPLTMSLSTYSIIVSLNDTKGGYIEDSFVINVIASIVSNNTVTN
jgi:hypothetical protein